MKQLKSLIQNNKKLFTKYFTKSKQQFYFIVYEQLVYSYSLINSQVNFIGEFDLIELDSQLKQLLQNKKITKNGDYYVFFNNAPIEHIQKANLTKEELFSFVQYKIAEYVAFPPEEASYDILSNNNEESNFFQKNLTAFIVNKNEVNFLSTSFKKYNLNLVAIDNTITGLRDFFGSHNQELTPNNTLSTTAYIKICDEKAFITIYQNYGVIISRSFNLKTQILETKGFIQNNKHLFEVDGVLSIDKNASLLEMSPINDISEKIALELHRMADYLDRQYGIPPFSKIIYTHDNDPIYKILASKIYHSFSIEQPSTESLNKTLNNISYSTPFEFEIAALSLRGTITEENINLNKKIVNNNQLFIDLKKILAICAVAGLVFTCIGSYFYIKNKTQTDFNKNLTNQVKAYEDQLATLNQKINFDDINKEISELENSKNNLLLLNPVKNQNQKILSDLSNSAKENNVYLETVTIDNGQWKLNGVSLSKEQILKFLNSISNDQSFQQANLKNIHIFPSKTVDEKINDNFFSFTFDGTITKENINLIKKDGVK